MHGRNRRRTWCEVEARRGCVVVGILMAGIFAVGCTQVETGTIAHSPRMQVRGTTPKPVVAPRSAARPVRTITLGKSVSGTPLVLEIFGSGAERMLIFGGIHGDEPTSAVVARRLADYLRTDWDLLEGRTIAILAEANPDGLEKKTRTNANGVDLNRNFPAKNWKRHGKRHGAKPLSEPESRAIVRAVEISKPDRIVSIHSARRGHHCNNYDGPAKLLAELMSRYNRYPAKPTMGYPTPGSFGSWAGVDQGIATITLELPRDIDGRRCWKENGRALLAFIDEGGPVLGR